MSLTQTLQGRASAWLLARPSRHTIDRASLAAAYGLLLAIILFFAAAGTLQWLLAERIQKNQTASAQASLEANSTALLMTQQVGDAHRSTLAYLLARDPAESQDALERRQKALETYRLALSKIQSPADPRLAPQKNQTERLAEDYATSSTKLIELVQSGQIDKALDYRLQTLRPLFESWQSSHENLALALAEQADSKNTDAESFIRNLRTALLVLIILPIVLLAFASLSLATLFGWEKFTAKTQSTPDPWSH